MRTLKYTVWLFAMITLVSCEKFDFENCNEENDETAVVVEEELDIPAPDYIEINGSEYLKYKIPSTINRIIIEDGNGKLHVDKGRDSQISIPGYWLSDTENNDFSITESTITINRTFSDIYLTIADLSHVEIVYGNSTTILSKAFATGAVNFDISHNSTVTFAEETEEVEPIEALDFYPVITMRGNGTFDGYGVIADGAEGHIHANGSIYVHVQNELKVNIPSNGKTFYKGNPIITQELGPMGDLIDEN